MESLTTVPRFRLREMLEERGLSQAELSRLSGISIATIHRLTANATSQVSLATLGAIATALSVLPGESVRPGDLIGEDEE